MSIPKVINYCWFGRGELPDETKRYIETWKKNCPDYKIIEWNEDNFDIHSNTYVEEAYIAKKYAFVTDYVRLYVLYNNGGIYMDADVEILKPIDRFLNEKAFSSFENNNKIPTGIMGAEKGNLWIKDLLDEYNYIHFLRKDGSYDTTSNTERITKFTIDKYGLIPKSSYQKLEDGIVTIYPYDYFCPKDWSTGQINITENTYTIHHFSGSWLSKDKKEKLEYKNRILDKYIKKYGKEKGKRIGMIIYKCSYAFKHPIKTIKMNGEKGNEN